MAATYERISGWFDRGVAQGATHLVVVCDTFDYEDYPVFVKPGEDAREVVTSNNGRNMREPYDDNY
jgi:hypothetical protein